MTKRLIVIMGVSGCGKSTIGKLLAQAMDVPFFDGDDYHPEANLKKMASGKPLNDEDRRGWLETLNDLAKQQLESNSCVIVCSALKQKYRELLSHGIENQTKWVHLTGTFDTIFNRMNSRKDHFMPPELLQSQFDTLESPNDAITLNIEWSPEEIIKKLKEELMDKSEFGLLGLGVMGKSLCRNLANNGFKISMFNRHVDGTEENVAINFKNKFEELASAKAFDDIEAFVNSLQQPRKIMLMVNAGKTIDVVIDLLIPYLSKSDIIIDGGNSNYNKTKERVDYLKEKNIHFIGAGVSGGEEGALKGPSIMPSGNKDAYNSVKPYLETIAAKDANNLPCCTYIGPEGSGHFVKMVHNGIEYAEMQLLAEVYSILSASGKNPDDIANILESWKDKANSYLLGITIDILRKKEGEEWLVNKILDKAGNKGTGNWATIATAELGAPTTMIATALFARYISFYKESRVEAHKNYGTVKKAPLGVEPNELLNTYQFARIVNHHQGFNLIQQASKSFNWNVNMSELARIWTEGCIIKSGLMVKLVEILKKTEAILMDESIIKLIKKLKSDTNKVVSECILNDLPIPCLSESLNFFNAFTTANSSANMIQAQRDYFGAHTYQRTDDATGKFYHTNWI